MARKSTSYVAQLRSPMKQKMINGGPMTPTWEVILQSIPRLGYNNVDC